MALPKLLARALHGTIERRCAAHLVYSWREKAKLLRGRVVGAHVVCHVFYVFCIVCLLA